jgi:hypothetical protein
MTTWAKRAGKLVFLEAEDLNEENIVTFCNLALFWHGQGAWRISHLHKGTVELSSVSANAHLFDIRKCLPIGLSNRTWLGRIAAR